MEVLSTLSARARGRTPWHGRAQGRRPRLPGRSGVRTRSAGWWHLTGSRTTTFRGGRVSNRCGPGRAGGPVRAAFDRSATGYGHGADEVGLVRIGSSDLLTGYFDAVYTDHRYLKGLKDEDWTGSSTPGFRSAVTSASGDQRRRGRHRARRPAAFSACRHPDRLSRVSLGALTDLQTPWCVTWSRPCGSPTGSPAGSPT